MSKDDNLDEFTKRRLRRDRVVARKQAIDQWQALDPDELSEVVENGAHAYLDYKDAVATIGRAILVAGKAALTIGESAIRAEGIDPGDPLDIQTDAMDGAAKRVIANRVAELEAPDLTLLVIPTDGGEPDEDHAVLIELFAKRLRSTGLDRQSIHEEMVRLQTALTELARPAVVYEMRDDYINDFFVTDDVVDEDRGPRAS